MKKLLIALIAFSVLFFSCSEKNGSSVEKLNVAPSLMISGGWNLYEERPDGKMYSVKEVEAGDSVGIVLTSEGAVEQKNAVRHLNSGKEEALDFVHVVYDGEEYWTRNIFVSGPDAGRLLAVFEDSFIYRSPSASDIDGKQLTEGTLVAAANEQDEALDFYKVVIYNGTPFGREVYLKKQCLVDGLKLEAVRAFARMTKDTPTEVCEEVIGRIFDAAAGSDDREFFDYLCKKAEKVFAGRDKAQK